MGFDTRLPLASRAMDINPFVDRVSDFIDKRDLEKERDRQNQLLAPQRFGQNELSRIRNVSIMAESVLPQLKNGDIVGAVATMEDFRGRAKSMGVDLGIDDNDINLVANDPASGIDLLQKAIDLNRQFQKQPAGLTEFESLTKGFTPGDKLKTRRIKAGLEPRAGVTSKDERIAGDSDLANRVAESQGGIAGAKAGAAEKAKLNIQRDIKPQIEAAISLARAKAKGKGEAAVKLEETQAALPGLLEVVDRLKELSTQATYTTAGRLFNRTAKELGFGATQGATARASFIAIVDNQVLPLLKATFGAAFTVKEGETLKATMGDPDATPEEKMAQLDAFIEGKYREIETKARQTGQEVNLPQTGKYAVGQIIDVGGKKYRVTGGDMNDPDVELVE